MWKMIDGQAAVVLLFLSLHTQSWSDELKFGAAVKSHQWLHCQHVETLPGNIIQSQQQISIHHIHREDDWWSSCCGFVVPVSTHTILVWWVGIWSRCEIPPMTPLSACRDPSRQWNPISTANYHSSYPWGRWLMVKLLWFGISHLYTHNLGLMSWNLEPLWNPTNDSIVSM